MTTDRRGSRAVGVVLVLVAAVLWSTGGIGIKSVDGPPLAIAGWRGLFALPVLGAMLLFRARGAGGAGASWWRPLGRPWAWMGAASYAVMVIFFVVATKWTTAADAIFIQYTSPVYVALLSWPLLRERVTWASAVACAGVLLGMALFFGDSLSAAARLGNAMAVVSSFGAAGLPLALRADQRSWTKGDARDLAAAAAAPALAIFVGDLLAVLLCSRSMLAAPPATSHAWLLLAALGLGQIGLPYVLYGLAIPRLTALEGSLVPTLEPILNPVWVAMGTGEKPGPMAIVGGGFVLASVLLQARAGTARGARDLTEA